MGKFVLPTALFSDVQFSSVQFSDGPEALRSKTKKAKEIKPFLKHYPATPNRKKKKVVWTKSDLKNKKRKSAKKNRDATTSNKWNGNLGIMVTNNNEI